MFTQVYITYYKWLIEANALQIQVMETRQGKIALTLLNNMVGRSKRTTRVNSSFDGIFNIMYCTDTAALQDRSHFVCMNSGKMEVRLPSHLEKQYTSKSLYLLHWDLFIQYVQLEDFQEDLRDLVRERNHPYYKLDSEILSMQDPSYLGSIDPDLSSCLFFHSSCPLLSIYN